MPGAANKASAAGPASKVAVYGLLAALLYIIVSAAMIMHVKFLMHADRFPFAPCLTSLHMLNAFVLGSALRFVAPDLFPSAPTVFAECDGVQGLWCALRPFGAIAIFGMLAIVVGNMAYLYADVSFLQMVKEGYVVIVYALMVSFGLDVPRLRNLVVLAFIGGSAVLAVHGASSVSFTRTGLLMQISAGFCGSMQQVMTNKLMSQSAGPRVDPLTMVLCTAPMMFIALQPLNYAYWDARIPQQMLEWCPHILGNMLLAFCLQVMSAIMIKVVSATGLALASVLKDIAIVFVATLLMGDVLTPVQLCGFVGSVVGIWAYSLMKIYPQFFDKTV